jgi:hypothetical protein
MHQLKFETCDHTFREGSGLSDDALGPQGICMVRLSKYTSNPINASFPQPQPTLSFSFHDPPLYLSPSQYMFPPSFACHVPGSDNGIFQHISTNGSWNWYQTDASRQPRGVLRYARVEVNLYAAMNLYAQTRIYQFVCACKSCDRSQSFTLTCFRKKDGMTSRNVKACVFIHTRVCRSLFLRASRWCDFCIVHKPKHHMCANVDTASSNFPGTKWVQLVKVLWETSNSRTSVVGILFVKALLQGVQTAFQSFSMHKSWTLPNIVIFYIEAEGPKKMMSTMSMSVTQVHVNSYLGKHQHRGAFVIKFRLCYRLMYLP